MAKAMTRKEVIKWWEQSTGFLDHFVCPDCRDVLKSKYTLERGLVLKCATGMCRNEDYFNIVTGENVT